MVETEEGRYMYMMVLHHNAVNGSIKKIPNS